MKRFKCRCGAKRDGIAQSASDKCSKCYTFSLDHTYVGYHSRCDLCNTRLESHR